MIVTNRPGLDKYHIGVYGIYMEQEIKKRSVHRINVIAGQIEGIKKMIENEEYCVDIINQSNAVQNSLRSLNALILENHLSTHIVDQLARVEKKRSVKELMDIYKFSP